MNPETQILQSPSLTHNHLSICNPSYNKQPTKKIVLASISTPKHTTLTQSLQHDKTQKLDPAHTKSTGTRFPTLSTLLRYHCNNNNIDSATSVLDQMLETGLTPTDLTLSALINCCCKRGKLGKAFEIVKTIGRVPNLQTYNCLLKGLCFVGRVEEAFEFMDGLKRSGTQKPDVFTYTIMMDGFCKVGRTDEAKALLKEAIQIGLRPNAVTFNTLFNGYSKEGRPLKGVALLNLMKRLNCAPDSISYSTLLHGLLLWGEVQAGLDVYHQMVAEGFVADGRLLNSLLRGMCRKSWKEPDLIQHACKVFREMSRDSVLDEGTYGLIIRTLCLGKRVDEALVSLQELVTLGGNPRVITMNCVIAALCVEEKVKEAILVLVMMYECGKVPSSVTYDLLITELNRQGRFMVACNVYGAALVRGVSPIRRPHR